jgi:hypothetical protein
MNQGELNAAIERANLIFSSRYRPDMDRPNGHEPLVIEAKQSDWPPESLDAERRFRQPHAKLFPFIGRKVRTPAGPGTLLQVFEHRVTILLDADLNKCIWFAPNEIAPAGPE